MSWRYKWPPPRGTSVGQAKDTPLRKSELLGLFIEPIDIPQGHRVLSLLSRASFFQSKWIWPSRAFSLLIHAVLVVHTLSRSMSIDMRSSQLRGTLALGLR